MNMNMYIVMYMNIYISEDNQKYLRTLDQSMSGLINKLLNDYRRGKKIPEESVIKMENSSRMESSSMVEQRTVNPKVAGSSPASPAIHVDATKVESIPQPVDAEDCPRHHVPKDICIRMH